jgi:uncharacterized protein related to proFAR isomerase
LRIPLIFIRDKQAFSKASGMLKILGKPLDVAKRLKEEGYRLIHIVDLDALSGLSTNLDIYDGLTYFINVQVECAPREELVKKLLSLKCRVVLNPAFDVSGLKEKKLLVAKIPKDYEGDAEGFHDVVLEDATSENVKKFESLGKRVMVYEKDEAAVKLKTWGLVIPFS